MQQYDGKLRRKASGNMAAAQRGKTQREKGNKGKAEKGKTENRKAEPRKAEIRKTETRTAENRKAGNKIADNRKTGNKIADNRKTEIRKTETRKAGRWETVAKDRTAAVKKGKPYTGRPGSQDLTENLQNVPDPRCDGGFDKLEGRNPVLEALRSGRSINRILVSKGEKEGSIKQIIALARQKHAVIQEIDRSRLDAMSETGSHQGVIALVAAKDYADVDDILKAAADSGRPPFIVILDEITDPHNLGSILRTANAAGVHGVIIPKRRAIGLTPAVSKASAGAVEYVPVARVTNLVQTIEYLKKQNIWVVGTDAGAEKPYFDCDLTGGIALVVGSEGEGMGRLVREACDFTVSIPMAGEISSLNAAVAGAIVIYEIVRQREAKNRSGQ
jgi:23S rRNA (guanosine2251-2'-O)-methyltransferase